MNEVTTKLPLQVGAGNWVSPPERDRGINIFFFLKKSDIPIMQVNNRAIVRMIWKLNNHFKMDTDHDYQKASFHWYGLWMLGRCWLLITVTDRFLFHVYGTIDRLTRQSADCSVNSCDIRSKTVLVIAWFRRFWWGCADPFAIRAVSLVIEVNDIRSLTDSAWKKDLWTIEASWRKKKYSRLIEISTIQICAKHVEKQLNKYNNHGNKVNKKQKLIKLINN